MDIEELQIRDAVDKFAHLMKEKMLKKYREGLKGYKWREISEKDCIVELVNHMGKHSTKSTQAVDIGTYAMMLHIASEKTLKHNNIKMVNEDECEHE